MFRCDVGIMEVGQGGLLRLIPNQGVDFTKLKSVTITATDQVTGVSTSAALTIGQ